jgi:putative ABC transport system permease protein
MNVPRASDDDWGFSTRWPMPARTAAADPVAVQAVTAAFLPTMRIPIVSGRGFTEADRQGSQRVAIVSENLARHFFGDRPAVGAEVRLRPGGTGEWATIVGVTRDVREPTWYELTIAPYWIYVPYDQHPAASLSFVVRTRTAPDRAFDGFRGAIAALDRELPLEHLRTAHTLVYAEGFSRRALGTIASVFGGLGVLLAGVGLYGVVMWSVVWRRRELAIRTALGADARQIVWPIVRDGLRLGVLGSLIGIPAALFASRALVNMLDDVSPRDPVVLAGVTALLFVVVLAGSYLPARRAVRINPAAALKVE